MRSLTREWEKGGGGTAVVRSKVTKTVLVRQLLMIWLEFCFTSPETVGLLGTGAQGGHLDFHTAPGLWVQALSEEGINYS